VRSRRQSFWSRASLLALLLAAASTSRAADGNGVPGPKLEEALLMASVNGVHGDELITLFKDDEGHVYVRAEQLQAWRIKGRRLPSVLRDGTRYYLLNGIPGARVEIDAPTQELKVKVPASELEPTRISYAPVPITDEVVSGNGLYLNYEVSGEAVSGETSIGGVFEGIVFTPHGVGSSGFVGRWNNGGAGLVRTETNWTIDDPKKMRSLRLGDSVSQGGIGGRPVRFAGIQLARNFAVQPGFVTIPLPSIRASAQLPSTADVYVNDVLVRTSDLPPGPFDITDVPIVTGSGDVRLIVRDMLGRQQLVSQPYYSSLSQLRAGLDDYSYEAGFLRRSFGTRSNDYGSLFISGTHRYGFTNWLTAEAHLEASPDVQGASLAGSVIIPEVGHLEGSVAASNSTFGTGASATLTFDRRTHGLSLGAHAEVASKNYTTLGAPPDSRPPSVILQAFAGMPFHGGSFGLSYLLRKGRTEPDVEFASANLSLRLGRVGSLNLAARTNISGPADNQGEVILIVPLGARTTSAVGANFDEGFASINALLQRSPPVGDGIGYRFNATSGRFQQVQGQVTLKTDFGDYDALLTWTDGRTGVRLSTSGSIGMVGGEAFVSRRVDQSFAEIKVGDYPNVRVYADNRLIGRTGRGGTLIIPNLRPYDRNKIRIEANDLPLDAELAGEELSVRPGARQGVVVDFKAKPSRSALIRVRLEDGRPLPGGSSVTVGDRTDEFISAPGGEVYMTGLDKKKEIALATWANGSCKFEVSLSSDSEPTVQCEPVGQ
jgi:outer membrane usher protein